MKQEQVLASRVDMVFYYVYHALAWLVWAYVCSVIQATTRILKSSSVVLRVQTGLTQILKAQRLVVHAKEASTIMVTVPFFVCFFVCFFCFGETESNHLIVFVLNCLCCMI
jgi:hypothetical protein